MSRGIRDTLVKNLGNLCPDNSNLEELTGFDVEAEAQTAVDLLQQLDDFVTNDLKEVQEGVQNAKDVTVQIDDGVSTIEVSDWQSLVILIPWVLVPSFMLVGVLMAWCSVTTPIYECLLQWFFLPLLIIMTILSLLLAALVSVAAVGNAGTLLSVALRSVFEEPLSAIRLSTCRIFSSSKCPPTSPLLDWITTNLSLTTSYLDLNRLLFRRRRDDS